MNFSHIAVQQREKEGSQLRSFMLLGLICSTALHIGVLAAGIGNLLVKVPKLEDEPIEMTFIEPEITETLISPEETKQLVKIG